MATTRLVVDELFSIAQVGSDEYLIEAPAYGTKWADETGSSTTPDVEDYIQEEEEDVELHATECLIDDLGNIAWKLLGGRPKKARRR